MNHTFDDGRMFTPDNYAEYNLMNNIMKSVTEMDNILQHDQKALEATNADIQA